MIRTTHLSIVFALVVALLALPSRSGAVPVDVEIGGVTQSFGGTSFTGVATFPEQTTTDLDVTLGSVATVGAPGTFSGEELPFLGDGETSTRLISRDITIEGVTFTLAQTLTIQDPTHCVFFPSFECFDDGRLNAIWGAPTSTLIFVDGLGLVEVTARGIGNVFFEERAAFGTFSGTLSQFFAFHLVPAPPSALLLLTGLMALGWSRRKKA